VEADSIFVQDGKVFTSAGAAAGMDLALSFVEADLGSDVARMVARFLVIYLRRPGGQSQFSTALEREAGSPGPVRDIQSWILEHLDQDLRVERLAEQVAMSPRNFARVFCREVGITPARYVEELRVEEAKRRLERSDEIVERIGVECGLGSALGLRRAFQRHLGISPGEYRERFGRN
jgi:transcriptional regulator GlxA family with amidase domain